MALVQSSLLPVGDFTAREFTLPGADGKQYALADFLPCRALIIAFLCNHCQYAKAAWPILIALSREYTVKGVEWVAINPNDEITYPEDSFEMMKQRIADWKIPFPYLRDGYQTVARAYQAVCTPDVYVFDANQRLYYHGRINDRWQDQTKVKRHDLKHALNCLLAGEPPPPDQVPSMGCSIKWLK